jgi:hypothetical protein
MTSRSGKRETSRKRRNKASSPMMKAVYATEYPYHLWMSHLKQVQIELLECSSDFGQIENGQVECPLRKDDTWESVLRN